MFGKGDYCLSCIWMISLQVRYFFLNCWTTSRSSFLLILFTIDLQVTTRLTATLVYDVLNVWCACVVLCVFNSIRSMNFFCVWVCFELNGIESFHLNCNTCDRMFSWESFYLCEWWRLTTLICRWSSLFLKLSWIIVNKKTSLSATNLLF